MKTLSGDIEYSIEDECLILHTHSGDVVIPREDLEELHRAIAEMLEYE